jgi:hypothetical protein
VVGLRELGFADDIIKDEVDISSADLIEGALYL